MKTQILQKLAVSLALGLVCLMANGQHEFKNVSSPTFNNGHIFLDVDNLPAPLTYTWSNGATTKNIFDLSAGSYTVTYTDANSQNYVEAFEIGITQYNYQFPWSPTITSTTHSITIPGGNAVTVRGQNLMAGDEIGVFYDSISHWVCAGFITWTGSSQTLTVYGNTTGGVGFDVNEQFKFLIRSQMFGYDFIATPQYNTSGTYANDSLFAANGSSGLIGIEAENKVLQTFKFLEGHNEFITYLSPETIWVGNVFSSDGFANGNPILGVSRYLGFGGTYVPPYTSGTGISPNEVFDVEMAFAGEFQIKSKWVDTTYFHFHRNTCFNTQDGLLSVEPFFGIPPYSFSWSNGATSSYMDSPPYATSFNVTITDSQLNSDTIEVQTYMYYQTPLSDFTISSANQGFSDGWIEVEVEHFNYISGIYFPMTYLWSTGNTSEYITNLSAGIYTLTVENWEGCLFDTSVIVDNLSFYANLVVPDTLCYGPDNGYAFFDSIGGISPYSFLWSTGSTNNMVTGHYPGNYSVTIMDSSPDTVILPFSINSFPNIGISANVQGADAYFYGHINLNLYDGVPPFSFVWSNGATSEDVDSLTVGTYTVSVTDGNACTYIRTYQINPYIYFRSEITNANLPNLNDGAIVLQEKNNSGLTQPISFMWSNGETTKNIFGLSPGSYSVTFTDAQNITDNIVCEVGITNNKYLFPWYVTSSTNYHTIEIPGGNAVTIKGQTLMNGDEIGVFYDSLEYWACGGSITWNGNPQTLIAYSYSIGSSGFIGAEKFRFLIRSQLYGIDFIAEPDFDFSGSYANDSLFSIGGNSALLGLDADSLVLQCISLPPGTNDFICYYNPIQPYGLDVFSGFGGLVSNGSGGFISNCQVMITGPNNFGYWSQYALGGDSDILPGEIYTVKISCSHVFQIASIWIDTAYYNLQANTCFNTQDGSISINPLFGIPPYTFIWNTGDTSNLISDIQANTNYTVTITDSQSTQQALSMNSGPGAEYPDLDFAITNASPIQGGSIELGYANWPGLNYFAWSNGGTSTQIINQSAGTYILTVGNDQGCLFDTALVINTAVYNASLIKADVSCYGLNDGFAYLDNLTGVSPYTFLWSTGFTGDSIAGLAPGNYSVTVTDSNSDTQSHSFYIYQPDSISFTYIITPVSAPGNNDGAISITTPTGGGPYSYQWSNWGSYPSITLLSAGTYSLTLTNTYGCAFQTFEVGLQTSNITATSSITDILCNGDCTGTIDLTVSGGNTPYSFNWSNGDTTADLFNLCAGNYSVTVSDFNLDTFSLSFDILQPGPISISSIITNETYNPGGDGAIDLTVTGGDSPYSFAWSNGAVTEDISSLSQGTYSLTITDANSCTETESFEVDLVYFYANIFHANSPVFNDGYIKLFGGGPLTTPISFNWSNGASTKNIFNLTPGIYIVTYTDAINQSGTQSFEVGVTNNNYPFPWFVTTSTFVHTIQIPGGNAVTVKGQNLLPGDQVGVFYDSLGYWACGGSIIWTGSAQTLTVYGDVGGNSGFEANEQFRFLIRSQLFGYDFIASPAYELSGTYLNDSTFTNGGSSGVLSLVGENLILQSALLSKGLNNFYIDHPPVNPNAIDLFSTVVTSVKIVKSFNGGLIYWPQYGLNTIGSMQTGILYQTGMYFTDVVQFPCILSNTALYQIKTNTCYNVPDGFIEINASFGLPPYTYSWNTGATANTITNIPPNTNYSVTVTDALLAQQSLNLTSGPGNEYPIVNFNITNATSTVGGSAEANVFWPYGYYVSWSTGSTTNMIINQPAGTYNLTIENSLGCMFDTTVTINSATFNVDFLKADISCFGMNDGSAWLDNLNGVSPYSFLWSTGATVDSIFGLSQGNYSVTIIDNTPDTVMLLTNIINPTEIEISHIITDNTGTNNGAVDITVWGGTPPYSFIWSNGATTEDIANLPNGFYSLTIEDANSCPLSDGFIVSNPPPPAFSSTAIVTHIDCYGDCDGAIDLTVTGGYTPYTYSWSNGATTQDLTNMCSGIYQVTVSDFYLDSQSLNIGISQPPPIYITPSVTPATSVGAIDGAIDLTVQGGNSPYTFAWSTGATTEDISGLSAGTYYLSIFDNDLCSYIDTLVVDYLVLSINESVTDPTCYGNCNGQINLTIINGTPPYSTLWAGGETNQSLTNVCAGYYPVTVTDAASGIVIGGITVLEPDSFSLVPTIINENLTAGILGSINLNVSGGTSPYNYAWSNGATTEDISFLLQGTYFITLSDANLCFVIDSFIVGQDITPILSVNGTITDIPCYGDCTGAVDLSLTGGITPYTFDWSNGETSEDIDGLCAGSYSVNVFEPGSLQLGNPWPWSYTFTDSTHTIIIQPGTIALNGSSAPVGSIIGVFYNDNGVLKCGGYIEWTGVTNAISAWADDPGTPTKDGFDVGEPIIWQIYASGVSYILDAQYTIMPNQGYYANSGFSGIASLNNSTGAFSTFSFTVNQASELIITSNISPVDTVGGNNGEINITVSGGTPPFSFEWSNGATTEDISSLGVGAYIITVTDDLGCTTIESFVLTVQSSSSVTATASITDIPCYGDCTGAIDLTVTGGTSPYSFIWSNNETTEDVSGLCAGNYMVNVFETGYLQLGNAWPWSYTNTGFNHSILVQAGTITLNGGPPPVGSIIGVFYDDSGVLKCGGYAQWTGSNASVAAWGDDTGTPTKDGFAAGEAFTWQIYANGVSYMLDAQYIPLSNQGNYVTNGLSAMLSLSNSTGAFNSFYFTVNQANELIISSVITPVDPGVGNDGGIDLTVAGGTPPYTFAWSNGGTGEDISALSTGTYHLTFTDANGCAQIDSFEVGTQASGPLAASGAISGLSCNGDCNGAIDLSVSGGILPYSYFWSNGETTEDIDNLCAANYTVTIHSLDTASAPPVSWSYVNTGSNHTILIQPGVVTINGDSIQPGDRVGVFYSDNGTWKCGGYTTWTGGGASAVTAWGDDISPGKNGFDAGEAFNWKVWRQSDGAVINMVATYLPFSNLGFYSTNGMSGLATLEGTTFNTVVMNFMLAQPASILVSSTITHVDPTILNNGAIDLTVSGGTLPYSFAWSNGETTEDLTGLSAGTYFLTFTDANLCSYADSFEVSTTIVNPLSSSGAITNNECFGDCNGMVDVTASGGNSMYSFLWSNGETNEDIDSLCAGNYALAISDQNSTYSASVPWSFSVTGLDHSIFIPFGVVTLDGSSLQTGDYIGVFYNNNGNFECGGYCIWNGTTSVYITVRGDDPGPGKNGFDPGEAIFWKIWRQSDGAIVNMIPVYNTFSASTGSFQINGLSELVGLTGNSINTMVVDFDVLQPELIQLDAQIINAIAGVPVSGSINLTVTGGTTGYSYIWSTGATTQDISGLTTGIYDVTVTDANGCTASDSYHLWSLLTPPDISGTGTVLNPVCNSSCNGSIDLNLTTGGAPVYYFWSDGSSVEDRDSLCAGMYDVSVYSGSFVDTAVLGAPWANCSPYYFSIDSTTEIEVCFWADHTFVSDLGFYLEGPSGEQIDLLPSVSGWNQGASVTNLAIGDVLSCDTSDWYSNCNSGNHVDEFCFTSSFPAGNPNYTPCICDMSTPLTGDFASCESWADLYGLLPSDPFSVRVTDCTPGDMGYLQQVTMNITSQTANGTTNYAYTSGPIYSTINDNSCSPATASSYTFASPPTITTNSSYASHDIVVDSTSAFINGLSFDIGDCIAVFYEDGFDYSTCCGYFYWTGSTDTLKAWQDNPATTQKDGFAAGDTIYWKLWRVNEKVIMDLEPLYQSAPPNQGLFATNGLSAVDSLVGWGLTPMATWTSSFQITDPPAISMSQVVTNATSAIINDGAIDLTVAGGTSPYSILWSNGESTEDIDSLTPGMYGVSVTDANLCMAINSFNVSSSATSLLSANGIVFNDSCFFACQGAIDLTVTGGFTPYSFLWSNGETTEDINSLCEGAYHVSVHDNSNDSLTLSFTITQPDEIIISPAIIPVNASTGSLGEIYLTITGGTSPYFFAWSNGASTEDISNLNVGTYILTLTDSNGCGSGGSYFVSLSNPPPPLSVSDTSINVLCNGLCDGSIDLTPSGGLSPYSFSWSTGDTTEDLDSLCAGTYDVTVESSAGTVAPMPWINQPAISGYDQMFSGEVKINGVDADPGDYLIAFYPDNGNLHFSSYGILTASIYGVGGAVQLHGDDPTTPQKDGFAYWDLIYMKLWRHSDGALIDLDWSFWSWYGSSSVFNFIGQGSGIAEFYGSYSQPSFSPLQTQMSFEITQPTVLSLSSVITDATSTIGNDGSIDLTVSGGVSPYSFIWTNGASTEDIGSLNQGTYYLTVIDSNQCSLSDSFVVNLVGSNPLSASSIQTDINCFGYCTGEIDLTISGGYPPIFFSWSNGETGEDIFNLCAGIYDVTISDFLLDTISLSVEILQPDPINLSTNIIPSLGIANNGAIYNYVWGGTQPYSFIWSNGDTTEDIDSLAVGTYYLTIIDINSCVLIDTFEVFNQATNTLTANTFTFNNSCNGSCNGSLDLTVTGGTSPYVFEWSTGEITEDISGLCAGNYKVSVWDTEQGNPWPWTYTNTGLFQTIIFHPNFSLDGIPIPNGSVVGVFYDDNGTLKCGGYGVWTGIALPISAWGDDTLTIQKDGFDNSEPFYVQIYTGGIAYHVTANYDQSINQNNTFVANALSVVLSVESVFEGYNVFSFNVTEPDSLILAAQITNASPANLNDGAIDLTIGGTPPVFVTWSNGETAEDIDSLTAGIYSVTIIDTNGCFATDSFEVLSIVTNLLSASGTTTNNNCYNSCDGAIDLTVSGGFTPYSYFWSNGETVEDISSLCAGFYDVTIIDSFSDTISLVFEILQPDPISIIASITNATNSTTNDGAIDITVTGGVSPYSYFWGYGQQTEDRTNLLPGVYLVTVTDANTCQEIEHFVVGNASNSLVDLSMYLVSPMNHCEMNNSDSVKIILSNLGGMDASNFNVSYNLPNGVSATELITDTIPGYGLLDYTFSTAYNGAAYQFEPNLWIKVYSSCLNDINPNNDTISTTGTSGSMITVFPYFSVNNEVLGNCLGSISIDSFYADNNFGWIYMSQYHWNEPGFNSVTYRDSLCSGTYTLYWSDGWCWDSYDFEVGNDSLMIQFNTQLPTCSGMSNGSISAGLNFSGGGSYSYLWSTGDTTSSVSGLPDGTYFLTISESGTFLMSDSVVLVDPPAIVSSGSVQHVSAGGFQDGAIDLTVSGGTSPYTILWSNGETMEDIDSLAAGTYGVTVTDVNFCTYTESFTVDSSYFDLALISILSPANYCAISGLTDITVEIANLGNQPSGFYDITWQVNNLTPVVTVGLPLIGGDTIVYTLGVFDFSIFNPSDSISLTIFLSYGGNNTSNDTITLNYFNPYPIATVDNDFMNLCVGSINIDTIVNNSGDTITYYWGNPAYGSALFLDSLCAGSYTFFIDNCIGLDSFIYEIGNDTSLIQFNTTMPTCSGMTNGSISAGLNYSPGSNYSYLWSTGDTTSTISGLAGGAYFLTINESGTFLISDSVVLVDPPAIVSNGSVQHVSAGGVQDGAIDLTVTGGIPPYVFVWSNGATTEDIDSLIPDLYYVTLTDANSCSKIIGLDIHLTTNGTIVSDSLSNIDCYGACTGAIDLTITGGNTPFYYLWSTGETSEDISNLCTGTYSVDVSYPLLNFSPQPMPWNYTITDQNHIIVIPQGSITIDSLPAPVGSLIGVFYNDNGVWECGGYTTWTGAIAAITAWGDDVLSPDKDGFVNGETFMFQAYSNGNYYPLSPEYDYTTLNQGNYATWGISYLFSLHSPTSGLETFNFTITQPDSITANAIITNVDPVLINNGAIDLTVSGGTTPYTFAWSNGATSEDISNLIYGEYIVTITDANLCQLVDSFMVNYSGTYLSFDLLSEDALCNGSSTGSAWVSNIIGVPPYTFAWSNGSTTDSSYNIPAGTYYVTVSAGNGDVVSDTVEVLQPDELQIGFVLTPADPVLLNDGAIDATVSGGTMPYSYLWSNGSVSEDLATAAYGAYQLTVTDANLCVQSAGTFVDFNLLPDWNFNLSGTSHSIEIPSTALLQINGSSLGFNDFIGVFYDSLGSLSCGGYVVWHQNTATLLAYGDNPATTYADGFASAEEFEWIVWDVSTNTVHPAAASYNPTYPNQQFWQANGQSGLDSLQSVTISGTVSTTTKANLPLGMIVLYQPGSNSYYAVDKGKVINGQFEIEGLLPGDYLVYAIPVPGHIYGIPGYYATRNDWQDGHLVHANGYTGGIDIVIDPVQPYATGTGAISGNIYVGSDASYNPDVFGDEWFPATSKLDEIPARNITVLLFNDQMVPLDFRLSSDLGAFEFGQMELGTYFVKVEKAGLQSTPVEITLTAENPSWGGLTFSLETGHIISVYELAGNANFSLFPNPVTNELYIQLKEKRAVDYTFKLFSVTGQELQTELSSDDSGLFKTLDMSKFNPGIYFIEISDSHSNFVHKIIKGN